MKSGSYTLATMDVEGYKLMVPDSYINTPYAEIQKHTGGCGPGKLGDSFVPDTILGESIFLACQIHDWMYYVGIPGDKDIADRVFLWNMVALIDDGEVLDQVRLRTVMTYYQAVRIGGDDSFGGG